MRVFESALLAVALFVVTAAESVGQGRPATPQGQIPQWCAVCTGSDFLGQYGGWYWFTIHTGEPCEPEELGCKDCGVMPECWYTSWDIGLPYYGDPCSYRPCDPLVPAQEITKLVEAGNIDGLLAVLQHGAGRVTLDPVADAIRVLGCRPGSPSLSVPVPSALATRLRPQGK